MNMPALPQSSNAPTRTGSAQVRLHEWATKCKIGDERWRWVAHEIAQGMSELLSCSSYEHRPGAAGVAITAREWLKHFNRAGVPMYTPRGIVRRSLHESDRGAILAACRTWLDNSEKTRWPLPSEISASITPSDGNPAIAGALPEETRTPEDEQRDQRVAARARQLSQQRGINTYEAMRTALAEEYGEKFEQNKGDHNGT